MELAGDRTGRVAARARETEAGRHERRRRPVAYRDRGEGRRSSRGPARTGLGAVAGHGQGDPRRGSRTPTGCTELATGVDGLRKLVADADLDDLATRCDLPRVQIERVARDFAAARGAMVVTRTGVSLHLAGTVAEWLGHVLNVITG